MLPTPVYRNFDASGMGDGTDTLLMDDDRAIAASGKISILLNGVNVVCELSHNFFKQKVNSTLRHTV